VRDTTVDWGGGSETVIFDFKVPRHCPLVLLIRVRLEFRSQFTVKTIRNTDTVRTSQETHYVTATETNRLILFGGTVAVYCENHTEHTDTVRTSQETHYVSTKEPNRLMLFGETVAVYCENHTEHTDAVRTSQETHYVTATETNRLTMLVVRTIRYTQMQSVGRVKSLSVLTFWRLNVFYIQYKNSVRTSRQTHYVSATNINL
jgi:hypothetical protein